MVYNNKFVVVVKVDGRVLRETRSGVTIPFGSEYSILLKNLNNVKALVTVYIDGQDVGGGTQFVIEPNSSVELERYIRNGNMSRGNRFKFIERTEQIEDARGIKADDGLIRVEYKFEKPTYQYSYLGGYYVDPVVWHCNSINTNAVANTYVGNVTRSITTPTRSLRSLAQASTMDYGQAQSANVYQAENCMTMQETSNDAGITVPGSESNQQFRDAAWFQTESESHVIVLQLRGTAGGTVAKRPVTVTCRPVCTTCHKVNSPWDKFCSRCGTSLTLI